MNLFSKTPENRISIYRVGIHYLKVNKLLKKYGSQLTKKQRGPYDKARNLLKSEITPQKKWNDRRLGNFEIMVAISVIDAENNSFEKGLVQAYEQYHP